MKRVQNILIIVIAVLVLSACGALKSNGVTPPSDMPAETAMHGTDSVGTNPDTSPSPQTSLFGEVQYGGSVIQAYTFNGKLENAVFRKHASLPYGVYVPEFMDQRELAEGVEWGYGEPRNSFTVMDGSVVQPEIQTTDPELAAYKEYLGTDQSDPTMEYDYFLFHGESDELLVRFAYTPEEKENARKLFLSMITSIRETHASSDFTPGVFLAYEESTLDETQKAVLQCALASMKSIAAQDAKAFVKSLESQALADALSFMIGEGTLYRFEKLDSITTLDKYKFNVNVTFKALSKEGFLFDSCYAFTVRKNKAGEWKVANID